MRIVPGFIIREIAGEVIVVPTSEAAGRLSGMITLNGCGRFLFELLQEEQTLDSLTDALLEEYDIDRVKASADVQKFVASLEQYGFLE